MAGVNTTSATSYLTPTTNTLLPKTGMDPVTGAALIGAGGSAITGGIGASGSKKAGDKAKAAAEAQAEAVQQAAREAPLIGFGMETLGKKYGATLGGPMDRFKAFEEAKLAGALSRSPATLAKERTRLAQEMAGLRQGAYGREMDPFARFT